MKPDLGKYYQMLESLADVSPSLSLLSKAWPDVETWRARARGKVFELLAFDPLSLPLEAAVESTIDSDGVITEEISYSMPYGPRTHGFFLYPKERCEPLPAVVALHDHGSFFYFGKEKITAVPKQPKVLRNFIDKYYDGREWATELSKRGFAVLVVDSFLFGSRRIQMEDCNEEFQGIFEGIEPGSDEYISKYNDFWETKETLLVVPTILHAGTNWPGIFYYEDRRSLDYLITRPEVDPSRIACGGLSGGGLRTIFLAGLDSRIRCGFCVGFMSTLRRLLRNHIRCPPRHGLYMYVPGLVSMLDLPDVIALRAPSPLMVQFNEEDELFTYEGQHEADRQIAQIYSRIGQPNNYLGRFYPGMHKFDTVMQEEAFDWLETQLMTNSHHMKGH